jgi:type I restriction enzyme R subunit
VKITGDDEVGKRELDNFTDVEERFPVIATTSKMLTTGIDTKMVKLIVLEANIASMTEFKQVIGRGTRIREAEGKLYFSIMDFRRATNLFADPDFDGEPVVIYEPEPDEPVTPPDEEVEETPCGDPLEGDDVFTPPDITIDGDEDDRPKKYYVNNIKVSVANERVHYYGADGKLITESLKDYTKQNIKKEFVSLDDFINKWSTADKKEELIKELAEHGILLEALREEVGKDMDDFDLICHIAFDKPSLTRHDRANKVRKRNYFAKYDEVAKQVLNTLLEKYENEGISSIENSSVLKLQPFTQMGSPVKLVKAFGKKDDYENAVRELQEEIYSIA